MGLFSKSWIRFFFFCKNEICAAELGRHEIEVCLQQRRSLVPFQYTAGDSVILRCWCCFSSGEHPVVWGTVLCYSLLIIQVNVLKGSKNNNNSEELRCIFVPTLVRKQTFSQSPQRLAWLQASISLQEAFAGLNHPIMFPIEPNWIYFSCSLAKMISLGCFTRASWCRWTEALPTCRTAQCPSLEAVFTALAATDISVVASVGCLGWKFCDSGRALQTYVDRKDTGLRLVGSTGKLSSRLELCVVSQALLGLNLWGRTTGI